MQYISYDIKTATICMSTKIGEIYSFKDLLYFNIENKGIGEISAVGNKISSICHNPGRATIEIKLNENFFKEDIEFFRENFNEKEFEKENEKFYSYLKNNRINN